MKKLSLQLIAIFSLSCSSFVAVQAEPPRAIESDDRIEIETDMLSAQVAKRGYVSGIKAQSFRDKKSGANDLGFGLDIADWIMEPGSDEAYRDQLPDEMVYRFGNEYHGNKPKRSIEGPQICTQAKELKPEVIRGKDFVAIKQTYRYQTAAPGKKVGSVWTQVMVFPQGERYYLSMQKIEAVNSSEAMFLRVDMPGHIKHQQGDSFREVFLSYQGRIPAAEFVTNFAPDAKFNYTRSDDNIPSRFIRAYRISEKGGAKQDVWLAGMTLDPGIVSEAWCHQRGYVCMIEEFGGRPIKAGESFSAAFVVGFFDSIEEMEKVYDKYRGNNRLEVDSTGWRLRP